ncbi:hypothetical protein FHA58_23775 [Escherichia coli]|nr:hypothetical protein [Escherichia coli]HAX0011702.1 hypothetical protein [Escherichia coli JJ2668]MBW9548924.1 hypothetical protein [Escherichia coli]MBW9553507.1 hypothetical protein [Escherichia coli]MBW9557973.1 hypothetical protein [Escherichia coli]
MEIGFPFMGDRLSLCRYSWAKRLTVYSFIFSFLWVSFPRYSYSFVPAIAAVAARAVIPKVVGRVLVRRFAANDAIYTASQLTATRVFVGRAAANAAEYLPAASSYKMSGVATWAGIAAAVSSFVPSSLSSSDGSVMVMTNGKKISDNLYEVTYSGQSGESKTITVNFEPQELSPVILHVSRNNVDAGSPVVGVETGYSTPDNALYYYQDSKELIYYYGDNPTEIARNYLNDYNSRTYTETLTNFERTVTNKVVNSNGDVSFTEQNYKFTYPSSFYEIPEITHLYSNPSASSFPAGIPMYENVAGLPMYYSVAYLTAGKQYQYHNTPCKTTNQSTGGYSTICAVPEKEDYTAKDIDEKSELTIWTNTKYKAMTEVLEAGNIESMIDYLEYLDSVSVSPALLADMINELWSEAAVNADYNGLPFKEVSPAEVTSAMSELRLSPTLLDMLSPVSDSAGADVNIDITINNNSGSDTGNNGNIALGEDPGVKEPELEETPTARDILTPIINLLPFTNEFNIGSRSASCPVVEFSVFNHQYRIDSHCPLIEQNRGAVETIFLIIWGFVALRIILSA